MSEFVEIETRDESSPEYICNYCGRSFTRKHNILKHINNTHVSTTCFCEICEEKLPSPFALQMHLRRGHNRFKQGNPECDLCGKIFTRKENVVTHLQIKHSTGKNKRVNTCEVCKKKFTNKKNLKAHVKRLHNPKFEQPTCDECNKVFRGKESLVAHIQEVHKVSAKDIQRCSLCEKVFSAQKNLKRHVTAYHGVMDEYKCEMCSKTYGSNNEMRRHVKTAHNIDLPREFACEHCSKIFSEQAFLDSHISLHHKQDSLDPNKHPCECGKVFDSEPTLRKHIKSDHEFDVFYSYCKNSLLRTVPIGAEKAQNPSTEFDCEICQEHFELLYDLRNHMKANHDLQLSIDTCKICFTKFYTKEAMNQHQKICVAPNNSIKCGQCDKIFSAKSSLKLHMKVFHPKPERPPTPTSEDDSSRSSKNEDDASNELQCKYCDKVFKSKSNVQRHVELVHLGMQRFKCIECESHFKERRNLRKHIRIKHPRSSTFAQCHFCQKRFECAKTCKMHLKQVHSFDTKTFPCEICSVSCTTTDSLSLHMKTNHTEEEELFKCESCSILFKGYETLEKHNQICQENMPGAAEVLPKCVICVKDFCTENSLKRHIRKFHRGFDTNELAAIGFSKRSFSVDCEECLESFTKDDFYQIYLKNKRISEAIVFKCSTCADTYNVIEFAVQRYKRTMKVRKRKQPSYDSDEEEPVYELDKAGCSKRSYRK